MGVCVWVSGGVGGCVGVSAGVWGYGSFCGGAQELGHRIGESLVCHTCCISGLVMCTDHSWRLARGVPRRCKHRPYRRIRNSGMAMHGMVRWARAAPKCRRFWFTGSSRGRARNTTAEVWALRGVGSARCVENRRAARPISVIGSTIWSSEASGEDNSGSSAATLV